MEVPTWRLAAARMLLRVRSDQALQSLPKKGAKGGVVRNSITGLYEIQPLVEGRIRIVASQ